tara:strand:- start:448 stop:3333 length:2886 start_codon:yes stop_codon:yes gene_type:complete
MFAELSIISNFTFLTGASHPEEYIERAALLGLPAIAIADVNSVTGIVRAHNAVRDVKRLIKDRKSKSSIGPPRPQSIKKPPSLNLDRVPRLIPGSKLQLIDGFEVTVLPKSRKGWGTLCRCLSKGRLRNNKGLCDLVINEIIEELDDVVLLIHSPETPWNVKKSKLWLENSALLKNKFNQDIYIVLTPEYDGIDPKRFKHIRKLSEIIRCDLVASAHPIMHHSKRRKLADVLTAIRLGKTIDQLGKNALPNAERRLRSYSEILQIFSRYPTAIKNTIHILDKLQFSLDELRYQYPLEINNGETPQKRLKRLAAEGLNWRYPAGAPKKVQSMLNHELNLIGKLKYEPYFLTVHDIVTFARSRGILCQGRGSAANSVVCYCLGVTSVSPEIGTMVFERFVSEARDEPPDIDIDFEHERREEVIQYIYNRYGRHRAGLCSTVIHYRGKRAIREVGTAMGLSKDTVSALSSQLWGFFSTKKLEEQRIREIGLNPSDRHLNLTLKIIDEIIGFPRHLSQHVGGFVITEGRLDELVPIENASMEDRTVISWDKDDIDSLGILKVDILSLGMLTCIRKSFDMIQQYFGDDYTLANLPAEDSKVYDMLCRADSIGVFQVESRAQMNFLPRMKPRCFYDLVIQVAIVRPGPIQGDMVHPYIRRRNGEEIVNFPSDKLGEVLGKTLGVPLFQEQAMQIAIIGANFSPDEADRLRRALATFKKHGNVSEFLNRFINGMLENGYDENFAKRCFSQIEGFGSYGFPESHAASFALLVYASAWIKFHYPEVFACSLLNSQPMGFYAPAQIIRDAKEHNVTINPVCINRSLWDNTLEPDGCGGHAVRLGFRQIKGMKEEDAIWINATRGNGYSSIHDVWRRAGISPNLLARLAEADVFFALGRSRREALWEAKSIRANKPLPLFSGDLGDEFINEPTANLPIMTTGEEIIEDYAALRFSLRAHPIALLRSYLTPVH